MDDYTPKPKQNKAPAKEGKPAMPIAVPTITPRFPLNDPAGLQYLEENGFVVISGVANQEEIQIGRDLAWQYLASTVPRLKRNEPTTWNDNFPDPFGKGIVSADGVGHSKFMWHARSIPNVKQVFANIWGTTDLATSFDGFGFFRPHEYNEAWKTKAGWYHLDQNGNAKPGKICVQGFLNYYPSGVDDGGLCVIPKSHLIFPQIFQKYYPRKKKGDWIVIAQCEEFWKGLYVEHKLQPIKVCCEPGDFVLWDSRTIHCSSGPLTSRPLPKSGLLEPRRLVAYICMTPMKRLTEEVKAARINAYYTGQTTSHWPEECSTPLSRKNNKPYKAIALTKEQKALIPLDDEFK